MTLPDVPAYSRGLLPYLRPRVPRAAGAPLPFGAEYDPGLVLRSLSGRPYLGLLPPLPFPENRAVRANDRWEMACPSPGCGFHDPSGVAIQAHWQRRHQSANEPDVVLPGTFGLNPRRFRAADWHRKGPISDVAGRREDLRRAGSRPWEVPVRGYACRKENTARFARRLDRGR